MREARRSRLRAARGRLASKERGASTADEKHVNAVFSPCEVRVSDIRDLSLRLPRRLRGRRAFAQERGIADGRSRSSEFRSAGRRLVRRCVHEFRAPDAAPARSGARLVEPRAAGADRGRARRESGPALDAVPQRPGAVRCRGRPFQGGSVRGATLDDLSNSGVSREALAATATRNLAAVLPVLPHQRQCAPHSTTVWATGNYYESSRLLLTDGGDGFNTASGGATGAAGSSGIAGSIVGTGGTAGPGGLPVGGTGGADPTGQGDAGPTCDVSKSPRDARYERPWGSGRRRWEGRRPRERWTGCVRRRRQRGPSRAPPGVEGGEVTAHLAARDPAAPEDPRTQSSCMVSRQIRWTSP